jgi:hypothetical protein
VTCVEPELAVGADDAWELAEFDVLLDVPELSDDPESSDDPADVELLLPDVELLLPVAVLFDVLCPLGRVKATTPAVTSPAAPTVTVTTRSLARPR